MEPQFRKVGIENPKTVPCMYAHLLYDKTDTAKHSEI